MAMNERIALSNGALKKAQESSRSHHAILVHLHITKIIGDHLCHDARDDRYDRVAEIRIGKDHTQGFSFEVSLKQPPMKDRTTSSINDVHDDVH